MPFMTLLRHIFLLLILGVFAAGYSDSSSPNSVFEGSNEVPESSGDDGAAEEPVEEEPVEEEPAEEEPAEEEPAAEILVTPSLGLISGADVTVTRADGTAIEGATGTLDANGVVTITHDGSYDGPILVTVTGNDSATYFDEAAGANLPMGSDVTIRAFAPSPVTEIGVTILTELAAQVMDDVEGAITADTVSSVNDAVRNSLAPDLPDILTPPALVSEENLTAQSLGTSDADSYALRLAALANMAAGDDAPAVSILQQLAADLADGDIDGEGEDGPLSDLEYTAENFDSLFAAAVDLAASTLADADLMAATGTFTVTLDANVLEDVIAAGVGLPDSVVDLINGSDGGDSENPVEVPVDISGDYYLTISGEIVTFGVGAAFEVTIQNILAPSPSDTAEITQVIEDTVEGVSGITNLQITIINNTADRIAFDVSFDAQQSGVTVQMNLRYDYVPAGTTAEDSGDAPTDDSTGSADAVSIDELGLVCFVGEPTAATIPSSIAGVYHLNYSQANSGGPYSDGELVHFTVGEDGTLDINRQTVLTTPVLCGGNEQEATWKDLDTGLIYSLSSLTNGFNEINLGDASGSSIQFLGQFHE
jgi:hypothetical protein